jgi:hypothetical protein
MGWVWADTNATVSNVTRVDNRTILEWFSYPYPYTLADFDKAEAQGLFVPRALDSLIYVALAALLLNLARNVFHKYDSIWIPIISLFFYCGKSQGSCWGDSRCGIKSPDFTARARFYQYH